MKGFLIWKFSLKSFCLHLKLVVPQLNMLIKPSKLTGCEDDFAVWFDHLDERFSYMEVQFKKLLPAFETSCPPAEYVDKTVATG